MSLYLYIYILDDDYFTNSYILYILIVINNKFYIRG